MSGQLILLGWSSLHGWAKHLTGVRFQEAEWALFELMCWVDPAPPTVWDRACVWDTVTTAATQLIHG